MSIHNIHIHGEIRNIQNFDEVYVTPYTKILKQAPEE